MARKGPTAAIYKFSFVSEQSILLIFWQLNDDIPLLPKPENVILTGIYYKENDTAFAISF